MLNIFTADGLTRAQKILGIEMFIGIVLALISVSLTIFNAVIIKCFEATNNLPTNLVIIRGVLHLTLFGVAVHQGGEPILPPTSKLRLLVVTRGVFNGFLFITNITAIRFLPLGDLFTILSAGSVVCIMVFSLLAMFSHSGLKLCRTKTCMVLVACLGMYLFLNNNGRKHQETGTTVLVPFKYSLFLDTSLSESTRSLGLAMAFLNLLLGVPVLVLTKRCENVISAPVMSFWSGAGGLMIGVAATIFCLPNSIFSTYYSGHEWLVMLILSISFIVVCLLQTQASTFFKSPVFSVIRVVQIPAAYLLCPSETQMPESYTVMGIVFVVCSGLVADWLNFQEKQEEQQDQHEEMYEEI